MDHVEGQGREAGAPNGAWHIDPAIRSEHSPAATGVEVRLLGERARGELAALLDRDPGFGLFLASNLDAFGMDGGLTRYWGAYAEGRLRGALMMVGHRATVYAPPGTSVEPLARVAAAESFDFTMGRSDLVDTMLAQYPANHIQLREEHFLAELADPRAGALQAPPPAGVTVRRASPADVEELTQLYYGSDGFEELTEVEVRRAMSARVRGHLRTWVAVAGGRILSGASTSAEAPGAAMIGGVWTATTARNHGLSTAVVAALTRELHAERRRAFLFYLMDNAPAARVYARCGYRIAGRWSVAYLARWGSP